MNPSCEAEQERGPKPEQTKALEGYGYAPKVTVASCYSCGIETYKDTGRARCLLVSAFNRPSTHRFGFTVLSA